MAKIKFSLFTKIIIWFFLNLLIIGAILLVFFGFNFRSNSSSSHIFGSNIESLTRQISNDLDDKTRQERDSVLKNYSENYPGVEFFLFDYKGSQLGGREIKLPPQVFEEITEPENFRPPRFEPKRNSETEIRPDSPRRMPPPSIYLRTTNPTLYWFGGKTMTFEKSENAMIRTRLLAASDSFYGYGLFFNPLPWFVLIGTIIGVSILFWFPLVRSITKSVGQITTATEQIAEENFDVRVSEKRTDELGRLGTSINYLAGRLSGFIRGQKRFLGDISHELNSPLARMNFALTILEDRVDEQNRAYVEDVKEEVELMSKLVGELLIYSKAGMKTAEAECERLELRPLVERETATENVDIKIKIEKTLEVSGQPELLSRALSNIVRNAARYAGDAGTITISAEKTDDKSVEIIVSDNGAGVPDDALEKIFDPLYRVESHRSRQTGGSGLGLAIVKTCVEACGGKVSAENLSTDGFAIKILLKS